MSKPSATDLTFKVNDNTNDTNIRTQYGVRLPDGSHSWGAVEGNGRRVNIQGMFDPESRPSDRALFREHWADYLKGQAQRANMDWQVYEQLHRFVKRTIILVVTENEEV
jgi:hypothetical protein